MTPLRFAAAAAALACLSACASGPAPYGPAESRTALGYADQQIETNRYRVVYRDRSPVDARAGALRRAAELTLQSGGDWFREVDAYTSTQIDPGPSSSVSVGGGTGGRRSGVGVGVGVGFPIGGGDREKAEHVLEFITGQGETPDDPLAYDAGSVLETTGLQG